MDSVLLDAAGHRRSPATMPGYHRGRPPRNKGEEYPADPPTIEEVVAVMRAVGDRPDGYRLRALILLLWRAGLRISEALAVQESDLDRGRGAVLVRRGKGGKRREVGMDRWAWEQLDPWLEIRRELPTGALPCVIHGPTAGRRWDPRPPASSCIMRPPRRVSGAVSLRTSCGTHTRSRWHTKASRWSSSSANSDTPTSASPASTYKGSTAARSSAQSMDGPHRRSPPTRASR
jgi:integrase